ncbi:hypothetical protein [Allosphingosinicella indica]|uniref:Uncharacterized protein n=1 Tax=Allosphingosinicella indica TaxID=941907 RepID=A0A1X7G857_9SPHN|nr:hypothetical protein [Allosphingosinicella indica]SMF65177.1 hypothetical protein SAMN06295910_1277 [Allosphingosinicella indica]
MILLALALLQSVGPNPRVPMTDPMLEEPAPRPKTEVPSAATAQPQAVHASDEEQYRRCADLAKANPEGAVTSANEWLVRGGGLFARQCLGLAYSGLERWEPAATAFEQAASEAEINRDPRGADFRVQAGNAWLAVGNAARARSAFDSALASTALTEEMRGEVHLDRARAVKALGDKAAARADVDKALALVPQDPLAWYLSSALALEERQLARAQDDIAKAVELAPDNADLLVFAGNVAGISGEEQAAKGLYTRAIKVQPGSDAAKAAQAALTANQ